MTGDHTPTSSPRKAYIDDDKIGGDGSGASHEVVVERIVRESGTSVVYPELTRTNYCEWALVLEVNLKAQGLWEAINTGKVERRDDQLALAALLRAVPAKMRSSLALKKSAKEAWEAVKMMQIGDDRVKEANAQRLLKEFENIKFKEGEAVDDFAIQIFSLVKKFLRVIQVQYSQLALSIEMLLDLNVMLIEELVRRLHVAKEHLNGDTDEVMDKVGRLMLAEDVG